MYTGSELSEQRTDGRLRYKLQPKSPKKIKMKTSSDTVRSGREVNESPVMMTRIKKETDNAMTLLLVIILRF